MNRANEILEYLVSPSTANFVLLAPNAPPVTKGGQGVEVAMNVVLDASDVTDTFEALYREAGQEVPAGGQTGSVAFGRRGAGRIRVTYATQRGSRVLAVELIASAVPPLAKLCRNAATIERLMPLFSGPARGVLAVTGPVTRSNSALVYSVLSKINDEQRKIVCVIERRLHYLLVHGSSIVMQSEVGTDVPTMEVGIRTAIDFEANILFVGDLWPADVVPGLCHAAGSDMLTVVSSSSMDAKALFRRCAPAGQPDAVLSHAHWKGEIKVERGPEGGLNVDVVEGAPDA